MCELPLSLGFNSRQRRALHCGTPLELYLPSSQAQRAREATLANAHATREEPGNLRFDLLRDASEPGTFLLYEAYVDKDAQRAHLASAHFAAWKASVEGVFAGRSIQRVEPVHIPGAR